MVAEIKSEAEFNELLKSNTLTVAVFSAEWAEQCKQILDVMKDLSVTEGLDKAKFVNVPAEEFSEISIANGVEAVPTVVFFQNGKNIHRINGVDIAALTAKCKELAGVNSASQESLETRLRALIHKAKVMAFIKGNRERPVCGFSKQLIEVLNNTKVDYETFDILSDEEVRQGLKKFSDWPTYPQVYVNGELIGGLDIIKELVQSGELTSTLNG